MAAPTARRPSSRRAPAGARRDHRRSGRAAPSRPGSPCRGPTRRTGRVWPPRRACRVHARIAEAPLPPRGARRCRSGSCFPDGRVLGAGGKDAPVMQLVRPAAFFARLGRRREDRLRRGVHGRRLDDGPRHRPRRPAGPVRRPDVLARAPAAAAAAARRRAHPAGARGEQPARTAGPTSPGTTTCPTSCSSSSSTRR